MFVLALACFNAVVPAQAATGYSGTITVNFHYQRADQTFNDYKAWVWCGDGSGSWGTGSYQAGANASGTCISGSYISFHNTSKVSEMVAQFTITGAVNVSKLGVIVYKAGGSTNCCGTRDAQSTNDRFFNLVDNSTDVIATDGSASFTTSVYNPNPTPTATSTSSATATATPSPTTSSVTGDVTVIIHYANQGFVSTATPKPTYYTHVWVGDGSGTITEGADPLANKDGLDSYGGVLKLHIPDAVNVSKVGIIEYYMSATNGTNWMRDAVSAADRFITLQGLTTEVWVQANNATFTYGPGGVGTQTAGNGDPLVPTRPAVQTVKIHYNRADGMYDGWQVYFSTQSKLMRPAGMIPPWISPTFLDFAAPMTVSGTTGDQTTTVGVDGFGPWVQLTLPYYAGQADWLNMIVAKSDWSEKDGGKQIAGDAYNSGHRYIATNANGTTEVWLLSGDSTSNGGDSAFASSPFTAPTVTSLSPTSAHRGDSVTVSGSNLYPVTKASPDITSTAVPVVTVGGVQAVVTDNNASSVTFQVPTDALTGNNDVVVSTAGGEASKLTLNVLHDPPVFDTFSPDIIHRGDAVTVAGANFDNAKVTVGGVSAAVDPSSTSTSLTFTVPESLSPGAVVLSVTSDYGTSTKSDFTIAPDRPTITSFNPSSGAVGTLVTITGTNLGTAVGVQFAGVDADMSSAIITDTSIKVAVPETITGPITVTTQGGSTSNKTNFTFLAEAPTVSSVDPTSVHRGDLLTISGAHLLGASVSIGGKTVDSTLITNTTTTSLTVTVPGDVTISDNVTVIVTTSGGSDATQSISVLPDMPTIEALDKTGGKTGDLLTITGTGLGGATSVTFDGDGTVDPVPADLTAQGTVISDNTITVVVPAGVVTGTITVTTPGGSATSSDMFLVAPPPTVDSLTLSSTGDLLTSDNPVNSGDVITVTGSNFGLSPTVTINGVPADVDGSSITDTSFTFTVPDGIPFATSNQVAVVLTADGGSASADMWVVIPVPSIDSIDPASGKPGDLVTINGLHLSSVITVAFIGDGSNPVDADLSAEGTVITDSALTIVVPDGVTTGPITVTTLADVAQSPTDYTIVAPPKITSLSKDSGALGDVITLTGTDLSGATLAVGTTAAVIADGATDTSITFTVPDVALGATTVAVTTTGGSDSIAFTVIPQAPKIKSISATSGKAGDSITISGYNLDSATVKVRTTSASIVGSPTNTSVTFRVPTVAVGATNVVVTTAGGTDSKSFTVLPAPSPTPTKAAAPKIISFTQSKVTKRGVGTVTVTGINLKGATVKVAGIKATVKSATASKLIFVIPATAKATTKGMFVVTTSAGSATSKLTLKITLK